MKLRRLTRRIRHNWKFMVGVVAVSGVVALGTAVAIQGLNPLLYRASLALKAMDGTARLTDEEKAEIKKLVKDKDSAKRHWESLSADQKERAKEEFGKLSEYEKQKYKEMFGK